MYSVLIDVSCKALPEKSSGTSGEDERATEAAGTRNVQYTRSGG